MKNYPDVVKRHIEILEEINLSEENNTLKNEIINLLLNNKVEDGNFDEIHKISLKKSMITVLSKILHKTKNQRSLLR